MKHQLDPKKILLAISDENEGLKGLLERLLKEHKHTVITTSKGGTATQFLGCVNDLHLVITELRLQDISGTEVVKEAREKKIDTIVFSGGYYQNTERNHAQKMGAEVLETPELINHLRKIKVLPELS